MTIARPWLLALLLHVLAGGLVAQDSGELEITVQAGFGNELVEGAPAPLSALIANHSERPARLRVSLIHSAVPFREDEALVRAVEVSPGVSKLISFLIPGQGSFAGALRFRSDEPWDFTGRAPGEAREAASAAKEFEVPIGRRKPLEVRRASVLVLGGRARQIAQALPPAIRVRSKDWYLFLEEGVPGTFCSLEERYAPDSWLAYTGFETILWTEPDLLAMPDPAQLRALADWVEYGGRLVLLAASRPELLQSEDLLALLPGSLDRTSAIPYPLPGAAPDERGGLRGPLLATVPAAGARLHCAEELEGWEESVPVRLERRLGMGCVVMACFDPLVYDTGKPRVLLAALCDAAGMSAEYSSDSSAGHSGGDGSTFGTLGGAIFVELLKNGNVLTPPLGLYVLLAILFVLLIGPIDYIWLKRLGKLKYSPLTLVAYTVLFSGASVGATYLIFAPSEEVNRLAILDFSEDAGGREAVHGYMYHGIYTPLGGSYVPEIEGFEQYGAVVTGRYSENPAIEQLYRGPGRQPARLDLAFNSYRTLASRISGHPAGSVSARIEAQPGRPRMLHVHNGLASRLDDCCFTWSRGAVDFHPVPPGESIVCELPSDGADAERVHRLYMRAGWFPIEPRMSSRAGRRAEAGVHPPEFLVRGLYAHSIGDWTSAFGEHRFPPAAAAWSASTKQGVAPWSLDPYLDEECGVLLATTTSLPFDDGLSDRRAGFTYALVRRLVELPSNRE